MPPCAPCRHARSLSQGGRCVAAGAAPRRLHQLAVPLTAGPSKMTILVCSSSSASVCAYLRGSTAGRTRGPRGDSRAAEAATAPNPVG